MPEPSVPPAVAWAERHLGDLVAVLVRAVRDPALALDLAVETVAAAVHEWDGGRPDAPDVWMVRRAGATLDAAVARGRVPSVERHRNRNVRRFALEPAQQREIAVLGKAHVDLDAVAVGAADALAATAPAPGRLRRVALSDLLIAETVATAVEHG